MDKPRCVLISGAGVAGLTAALWLGRGGVQVTVVEKARDRRLGGYVVALAHQAHRDAESLGIMPAVRARGAGITRSRYLNASGRVLLKLEYERLFKGIDIIQITRDDLVEALYESAQHVADIRFEETIESLNQDTSGVDVTFASGDHGRYDVVIGADGQNSHTRDLAFSSDDVDRLHLGLMCAAFRSPNVLRLENMFEKHLERQRYMVAHSMRQDDMGVIFIWQRDNPDVPPPSKRATVLRDAFRNSSVAAAKALDHCPEDGNFYMDPAMMITMNKWKRGRIGLIGDAAHTLTLFSGRGAAAAFADAGYLARALIDHPTDRAFDMFEAERLSHLHSIQVATKGAVKWYVPRTPVRHFIRDSAMAVLPNRFFEAYFQRKYSTV